MRRTRRTGFSVGGPPGLDVTVVQIVLPTGRANVRKWLFEELEDLVSEYESLFEPPSR